jgi:hypothetical protein
MKHRIFIFSTKELHSFDKKLDEKEVQSEEYKNFRLKYNGNTKEDYFKNNWLKKIKDEEQAKMNRIIYEQIRHNKVNEKAFDEDCKKMATMACETIKGKEGNARDIQIKGYFSDENKLRELFENSEYFDAYSYLNLYKCYKLNAGTNDEIIVIPVLDPENHDSTRNKEWILAILDAFKNESNQDKSNQETEYFLLLHDKDLKEYHGKDLYVLSKQETDKLTDNKPNVKILVFQHTSNDVTAILRNSYKENETADNIESLFHKYKFDKRPFKKMLVEYIDIKSGASDKKEITYQSISEYFINNKERLDISLDITFLEHINIQRNEDINKFKKLIEELS